MAGENHTGSEGMGKGDMSKDHGHTSEIGQKGKETMSPDREHMAEVGREGGKARSDD